MSETAQPKKKREMLSSFSIIFILLAVVAIITIVLNGQTYVLDGVEKVVTGATLGDFLMAPAKGFVNAVDVCLFVTVGQEAGWQRARPHPHPDVPLRHPRLHLRLL